MDGKLKTAELERLLKEYELTHLHTDVFEKTMTLVMASLGLITALAWDTALSTLFKQLFGGNQTLIEETSYAVTVTILAAVITVLLSKLLRPRKHRTLLKLNPTNLSK